MKPMSPTPPAPAAPPVVVHAAALLGQKRELLIEHAGARYRLSLTRNGKLILTK